MGVVLLFADWRGRSGNVLTLYKRKNISKGNILMIFRNTQTFTKYLSVVLVGVPIWYLISTFVFFSKRNGTSQEYIVPIPAKAIM